MDDTARVKGWLFAHVHKWDLLEPLGRDLRDGALGALLIAGVGILGLALFLRSRG